MSCVNIFRKHISFFFVELTLRFLAYLRKKNRPNFQGFGQSLHGYAQKSNVLIKNLQRYGRKLNSYIQISMIMVKI